MPLDDGGAPPALREAHRERRSALSRADHDRVEML
jgi:hypothetical protein